MVQFLNEYKEVLHSKQINHITTGTTDARTEAAGFKV
jgi:methylglyoxal synthase